MTTKTVSITHDNGVVEVTDIAGYCARTPNHGVTTCGTCDRSWDDNVVTGITPTPSARCPFEYEHDHFTPCDSRTLVAQIGRMNILAVSGGRVVRRETGITLPIRYGYSVTVDLDAMDTYVVRRLFTRGAKTWVKREWTDVYADEVGEATYRASCYLDD